MPKGKPWTVEDERQLRKLREEGKTVAEIALRMKNTPDAIKQKLRRVIKAAKASQRFIHAYVRYLKFRVAFLEQQLSEAAMPERS